MEDKHAKARMEDRLLMGSLRGVSAAAAEVVEREVLETAIKSFPGGSASGPSGMKPQHLKDALAPGMADEVVRHSTALLNLMAQGRAPAEVRSWLCGASLVALPKFGGGHRPVAVGAMWRRLVEFLRNKWRYFRQPIFHKPIGLEKSFN